MSNFGSARLDEELYLALVRAGAQRSTRELGRRVVHARGATHDEVAAGLKRLVARGVVERVGLLCWRVVPARARRIK